MKKEKHPKSPSVSRSRDLRPSYLKGYDGITWDSDKKKPQKEEPK